MDEVKNLTIRDILGFVSNPSWNLGPDVTVDQLFGEDSRWFLDIFRAAEKFHEGPAVITAWIESGQIDAYKLHGAYYIPFDATPKINMFKVIN